MRRLILARLLIPFLILFSLVSLFWYELFYNKQGNLPSPLIGETLPRFSIPDLFNDQASFSSERLNGQVTLLNVWASWCYACQLEEAMLMKISDTYHIPVYGIAYKDTPADARAWLAQHGNPFTLVGSDQTGDVGIDLGLYGTPETFVISRSGKIVYRHIGVITQQVWDEVLLPIVRKYS